MTTVCTTYLSSLAFLVVFGSLQTPFSTVQTDACKVNMTLYRCSQVLKRNKGNTEDVIHTSNFPLSLSVTSFMQQQTLSIVPKGVFRNLLYKSSHFLPPFNHPSMLQSCPGIIHSLLSLFQLGFCTCPMWLPKEMLPVFQYHPKACWY